MSVILTADPTESAPALHLRPFEDGDVEELVVAYRDPAMRRWLTRVFDDEAGARLWLDDQAAGWADGSRLSFAVLEDGPSAQTLVGHVVVKRGEAAAAGPGHPDPELAEIGYWTAATARGRGIAPRAVDVVSRWMLDPDQPLSAKVLELLHDIGNVASCRVAEKSGFAFDAMLPPEPPEYPDEGHRHIRSA